jgi:polysaccharide pyruvyl transferase WcaK-like protein
VPRILHVHFRTHGNVGDAAVVLAIRQLVDAAVPGVRWSARPMQLLRGAPDPGVLAFVNAHDLVIVGGGGFCSRFALPLDAGLLAGITAPLVLFGVGYNRNAGDPPLDDAQRASLAAIGHQARLVSVRDGATGALFAALGRDAVLTGDPAVFLRPQRPWWPRRRRRPRAIGVNLAAHGWTGQAAGLAGVVDAVAAALRALAADGDTECFYLQHTRAEDAVLRRLARELPGLRRCRYAAPGLAWTYGQLDLVVSMMLHSTLLAFAAGVPVVNVAYDDKNTAFFADLGRPERSLPAATVTAAALVTACRAALAAPRDREQALRARYAAATDGFVRGLAALLPPA